MKDNAEIINMTPTWEGILPVLLDNILHGGANTLYIAKQELRRMAVLADKYVALRAMLDKENKEN